MGLELLLESLVAWLPDGYANDLNGKIGILMSAPSARSRWPTQIELLIDGSVEKLLLYPGDLEFIGADDA